MANPKENPETWVSLIYKIRCEIFEDYQQKAADINHDGRVNTMDLTILRRGIAGGYDNVCQYLWRNC